VTSKRISVARRSPAYWRVTFDHPPLNIFGPESSLELGRVIAHLENDETSRWSSSTVPSTGSS
jgi:hypothetical protein